MKILLGGRYNVFCWISSILLILLSFLLIIWNLVIRPVEESFQTSKSLIYEKQEKDKLFHKKYWAALLDANKKIKYSMCVLFGLIVFIIVATFIILLVFR